MTSVAGTSFRQRAAIAVVCLLCCAAGFPGHADAQLSENGISPPGERMVMSGADVLFRDSLHLLEGRRVGLVCNHTAVLADGTQLFDRMREHTGMRLVAVFSPEHGFRGSASAGEAVPEGTVDGIPLHSLYGRVRKPTKNMLDGIDVLVFDMQDVGARYYTYISTLALAIEATAEAGIDMIVLDRPNPLGGEIVEGPIRPDSMRSFVAMLPVPVRHGMTIGEAARMMVGERWIRGAARASLRVIPMKGWRRSMFYEDTGMTWIPPSPNIVSVDAALAYVGTCLFEGSAVSEGRGTDEPFLRFGAPFINGGEVTEELSRLGLAGVRFSVSVFTPRSRKGAMNPKYLDHSLNGVSLQITDRAAFRPFAAMLHILRLLSSKYGEKMGYSSYLETLAGIPDFARLCRAGGPAIGNLEWSDDLARFLAQRLRYLLYP